MPNQITHIALTAKVFDKTFPKFDKREFFIGTIFPDIRYLGVIGRDKTHFKDITLDSVLSAKTSFEAGFLFHNLVDRIFDDNVIGSLSKTDGLDNISSVVKILADELFYDRVVDWPEITTYFDDVISEELNFDIDKKDLIRWHEAVKGIFVEAPIDANRSEFMIRLNFSEDQINQANRSLSEIRNNNDIIKILLDFYSGFSL